MYDGSSNKNGSDGGKKKSSFRSPLPSSEESL